MAYLQHTSWKDRPGAVIGVIAIHALAGYALVSGLSFKQLIDQVPRIQGTFVPAVPLDPPPPPPADEVEQAVAPERPVVAPLPPLDVSDRRPVIDTTPIILPEIPRVIPTSSPSADSGRIVPAFDPVAPRPRNDPRGWVTNADYRTSWINREWTGTARFRLEVAASGRVANCTITGSSGHAELDKATCELVTRRARFEPARDAANAKTAGSYSNAVSWQLPE